MASKKKKETFEVIEGEVVPIEYPPAWDVDSREDEMVNLAVNLAEKQLREGTASSQVIVHYLKLATKRERIEREIMQKQAKLIEAKVDSLESAKATEIAYKEAISAMKSYGRKS